MQLISVGVLQKSLFPCDSIVTDEVIECRCEKEKRRREEKTMKENKVMRNSCARMALNDEQLSFVTGGMYHGYGTSGNSGKNVGYGPGALGPGMGPGMGKTHVYLECPLKNPMIEMQKIEAEREDTLGVYAQYRALNH